MQLDFTADQDDLRDNVRSVLAREWPISKPRAVVEATYEDVPATEVIDALWSTVSQLHWPALTIPEELGGVGLGFVEAGVIAEEAGRVLAPGPLLPTISQFAPAVREAAGPADERAGTILGAVAAGTTTGTFAVAEGATWALDTVTARATANGSGFALGGTKRHVMDATLVDEIAVALRIDDELALAVVPAAEVAIAPIRSIDPSRVLADVALDGVRIDSDRVFRGPHVAAGLVRALEEATIAQALDLIGVCQSIFDTNLAYAKVRVQFDKPIGAFQAVKHKLANMFVAIERARATAYFAAVTIAEDDPRRSVAASMAKAAAGDCQRLVAGDGIQLLGGIGMTWEHDQHLFVKRAKADEVLFGTAAHHRARVADHLGI